MSTTRYYNNYWEGKPDSTGWLNKPDIFNESAFLELLSKIYPYINAPLLDAGAGSGDTTNALYRYLTQKKPKQKPDITAIDVSSKAIKLLKKKNPNIKTIIGDISNYNVPQNQFRTITAFQVVEHVLDTNKMFNFFNQHLQPKGYLIITTTDFNLLKQIIIAAFFWPKFFYPTNPHIRFYTRYTLESLAQQHGFRLVSYTWDGHYFHLMPKGQLAIFQKI